MRLARQADIFNPTAVKELLAKLTWQNSTKMSTINDYNLFLKFIGKTWTPPKYTPQEKVIFVPTEQEIDQLIAAAGKTLAPLLQLLKETGARIGEADKLTWNDIDLEHKTISINHPEKGSLPRILPISEKLKTMLSLLPRTEKPIFLYKCCAHSLKTNLEALRKRAAKKLGNPRLKQIHFHTFRHYKATTMFQQTRDSYDVRRVLGHKTATMTDRYIHQAKTQTYDNSEYTCKVAHNEQEATDLIENGFQYVNNLGDQCALYRKRK